MKVIGFIAEYNPFHNGHQYHLLESMQRINATHSIAIMSGNFLQRGEPALTNKWIRAEMAVKSGIDLVIELPMIYACNNADFFAFGAISLLNALNIVDFISFGSESGNIGALKKIAHIFLEEPDLYKKYLKEFLTQGLPFPLAREKAFSKYDPDQDLISILRSPNNILGIEYIQSLIKLKSPMIPYTLKRIHANYHSQRIQSRICSASAIRAYLSHSTNNPNELSKVMPLNSFHVLLKSIQDGFLPVLYHHFDQMLLYHLRITPKSTLKQIMDVTEGLENRIKNIALKAKSCQDFLQHVKTKRYTVTRLQRILIHSLLGITKEDILQFNQWGGPQYARILAFSTQGRDLLKVLRRTSQIPIITNINKQKLSSNIAQQMLDFDLLASNIYSLAYPNMDKRRGGDDYYNKPFSC